MPPSKRKLKATAASAQASQVKAAKERRMRGGPQPAADLDPQPAGEQHGLAVARACMPSIAHILRLITAVEITAVLTFSMARSPFF
mmetsp:Transcript_8880/g.18043  ORF Transcript_8880/g.18043 Transcript_8880/m.18043 type:complete len:86 (+) Transcript_8880:325-582(+)